jgi:hypothetical protein
MRTLYWCIALTATAFAATFASAQQAQRATAGNPLSRTEGSPFFRAFPTGPLDAVHSSATNALARPGAHFGPVTPVPEPSEWLMMVAGLGLVGVIVRRGARRS